MSAREEAAPGSVDPPGSGSRYAGWARREYGPRRRIGVTLLAGPVFLLALPYLVAGLGPRLDRRLGLPSPGGRCVGRIAGGALLVLGFALGFWSIITQLDRGRGTPLPLMPTQVLLTQGPFRYCRNPMTLGTILAYVGIGIGAGTTAGTLLVLGLGATLVAYLKRFEEAELVERFGDAYLAYEREVPFIVPRLRQSRASMR